MPGYADICLYHGDGILQRLPFLPLPASPGLLTRRKRCCRCSNLHREGAFKFDDSLRPQATKIDKKLTNLDYEESGRTLWS